MVNKLILGLAGLIALSSPAIEGSEKWGHPFGNCLIANSQGPYLRLDYNPDEDSSNYELRMHYNLIQNSRLGNYIYELVMVEQDVNDNGKFDDDELVYKNPKYFPNKEEPEIPKGKKLGI